MLARPASAGPPERDGYWVSAEVVSVSGGDEGLGAALERLQIGPASSRPEGPGARPPGLVVGHVDSIERAFAYVDQHSFDRAVGFADDREAIRLEAAPVPGAALFREHGVVLRAIHLTGRTSDSGIREIDWPRHSEQVLPPHLRWRPATLWQEAHVFAAPSPVLPPASERFSEVRAGSVAYVLGELDRCAPDTGCLRWAQVVVRDADRLVAGYVPAFGIVYDALPQASISIQPFALGDGLAYFAIVFPDRRSSLSLEVPHDDETRFPLLRVVGPDETVEGSRWSVVHSGRSVLEFDP